MFLPGDHVNADFGDKPLPPSRSQTFDSSLGDAGVTYAGAAYCITRGRSPARIYKWTDLLDPTHYSFADFGFGFATESAAADAKNGTIYAGPSISTLGRQNVATIKKVNPGSLQIADFIVNTPVGTSGKALGSNSAICTDGTLIFLVTTSREENSWVYAYRCSDGAKVATRQLANTATGASTQAAMAIGCDDQYVYVAGGQGRGWAARLPKNLSSSLAVNVGSDILMNDDLAIVGDFFWVGNESHPLVYKIAKDLSSVLTVNTGAVTQGMDGFAYDGEYLWVGHTGGTALSAALVALDPNTATPVETYFLAPGQFKINELWPVPEGMFLTTLENPGRAIFLPLHPEPVIAHIVRAVPGGTEQRYIVQAPDGSRHDLAYRDGPGTEGSCWPLR